MINDKKLEQSSGNDSTNIQVGGNLTVGLSYSDAKDIALDIYKQNFLELSEKATEKALAKVEHFVNEFLTKLYEKEDENLISELETPSFQMILLKAQKEAIKADDKIIEEILSNILLERTKEKERTLKRIAFDEAISVVSKLTEKQMDILSLNYILKELHRIMNWKEMRFNGVIHILNDIVPVFEQKIDYQSPDISHLEYSGCIRKPDKYSEFNGKFFPYEDGLFQKPFTIDEFETQLGTSIFNGLLMNSEHENGKFQLDYIYDTELRKRMFELTDDIDLRKKFNDFVKKNNIFTTDRKKLFKDRAPNCSFIFESWQDKIYEYELTPVGVAISISNLMNKWDFPFDSLPFPYSMQNI